MYNHAMKKLFLLLLLFLSFVRAETIQCKVVAVTDGDTISCLTEAKEQIKVRLYQIDAPELDQQYGQEAQKELSYMILNAPVSIYLHGQDKNNHLLGIIIYEDGEFYANEEMVEHGFAWHYPHHGNADERTLSKFRVGQYGAQIAKRGLWANKNPVPPWEWRKAKKK